MLNNVYKRLLVVKLTRMSQNLPFYNLILFLRTWRKVYKEVLLYFG